MRKPFIHIALLLLLTLPGCFKDKRLEELRKWKVTLDRNDKRPYGAWLAYQSLKYHFPDAAIQTLSSGFRYTNMDNEMKYNDNGRTLLILQGFNFFLSEMEWHDLKQFINNGNEVVIFCSNLDSKIEQELGCEKKLSGEEGYDFYSFVKDHDNKKILRMAGETGKEYGYIGHSIKGFFSFTNDTARSQNNSVVDSSYADSTYTDSTYVDSAYADSAYPANTNNENNASSNDNTYYADITWSRPDTLGYVYNNPDFIRYRSGEGHITLHAAPLVLSNYFLLQPGNEQYLSALWQTLPKNINHIYWSDYYKRSTDASSMDILWRYPATKLALLLGIFALLVYILFEGKRKQRIIPVIEPLKNDSVSFVETVGRLYYNKGNQANLAGKMMMQFLEWVRTNYLLNTNLLNENFIYQLTIKSGQPEATVRGIVDMIHEIRLKDAKIDDAYLYRLYNTIQQFYKNHRI
ncbi:MAG: DUF4350 domain-containing protein [Chitinophagales bacterium]